MTSPKQPEGVRRNPASTEVDPATSLLPYISAIIGIAVVVLLWMALVAREKAHVREQVDVALRASRRELVTQIGAIDQTLHRIARFAAEDPASAAWHQGLLGLERDASWPRRVFVVDMSHHLKAAVPAPDDAAALLDSLRTRGALAPPVARVRYVAQPASTPILATLGLCDSVVACTGTLITEVDPTRPIEEAVGDSADGFQFMVYSGRQPSWCEPRHRPRVITSSWPGTPSSSLPCA